MELISKLRQSVKAAVPVTVSTTVWLLKIMLPISLGVRLLQYAGVIGWLAGWLDPVFVYMGLPGSSAITFMTGAFVTTYAGIAVMMSMEMTLRQATIVAVMMCVCHALPLEGAVTRKTGSSFMRMTVIRLVMAFVCAFWLNAVLPPMDRPFGMVAAGVGGEGLQEVLLGWLWSSLKLSLMIFAIILALMIVQRLLEAYDMIRRLSRPLRPLMRVFGLPGRSSYMWLVGNVLGISYGCAVMMDLERQGLVSRDEANDVNYHLIMNHSLVEDTLVFAALGVSAFWIVSTRVLLAMVVVWGRKGFHVVRARV